MSIRVSAQARRIDIGEKYCSGSGAECKFFKLDSFPGLQGPVGLKVYDSAEIRDKTIALQKKAARKGLGPKVLKDRIFVTGENIHHYSYDSEGEWESRYPGGYGYVTELAETSDYYRDGEVVEMKHAALKLGMPTGDIKSANIGKIEGRSVIIDFGPMTCAKWHIDAGFERRHGNDK